MNRFGRRIGVAAVALLLSFSAQAEPTRKLARLGLLEIGDVPDQTTKKLFVSTDCGTGQWAFGDCSGTDKAGRRYAFFAGMVVIVSLDAKHAVAPIRLPGGLKFGEDIRIAAAKLAKHLQLAVNGGTPNDSGGVSYSTDMILPGKSGAVFEIILVADTKGRFVKFVERTNSV